MANHGYVKTKKPMTPAGIRAILDELNATTFKNCFEIEQIANDSWFRLTARVANGKGIWGERSCWLYTKRTFEMRHGGGTAFIWWADGVILDEIARRYNGTISDDGVSNKWKPQERNQTLAEYFRKSFSRCGVLVDELLFVPPEFRSELRDLDWVKLSTCEGGSLSVDSLTAEEREKWLAENIDSLPG